jgi:hypothetical protein
LALDLGSVAPQCHGDENLEQDSYPAGNQPAGASLPAAVRFSSVTQEVFPEENLDPVASLSSSLTPEKPIPPTVCLTPQAQDELRNLSQSFSFQNSGLQQRRMSNFAFEPVSLPASRVCPQLVLRFSSLKFILHLHWVLVCCEFVSIPEGSTLYLRMHTCQIARHVGTLASFCLRVV